MHQLGLARAIDLALHLPLRYEDETRLVRLCDVREGEVLQAEGVVTPCEVTITGHCHCHCQLRVTLDDGSDACTLRFFSFYPAPQKALVVGRLIRARAATRARTATWRDGASFHWGWPACGTPIPDQVA